MMRPSDRRCAQSRCSCSSECGRERAVASARARAATEEAEGIWNRRRSRPSRTKPPPRNWCCDGSNSCTTLVTVPPEPVQAPPRPTSQERIPGSTVRSRRSHSKCTCLPHPTSASCQGRSPRTRRNGEWPGNGHSPRSRSSHIFAPTLWRYRIWGTHLPAERVAAGRSILHSYRSRSSHTAPPTAASSRHKRWRSPASMAQGHKRAEMQAAGKRNVVKVVNSK